jgi:hypothetical protein
MVAKQLIKCYMWRYRLAAQMIRWGMHAGKEAK